jgi:dolichol-phosphate mannosyltransferase
VVEVPYVFGRRRAGRSKLGPGAMVEYVLSLLKLSGFRVLKFAVVGASGAAVNLATVAFLGGRVAEPLAYAAGWEAGLTWNYLLHDAWTFRGRRRERGLRGLLRYWLRYHVAAAAGFAAYMAVSLAPRAAGAGYLAAPLLGIAAGFLANYLLSEHHVWAYSGAVGGRSPGTR